MREFTVSVRKLTDVDLMREACETTFDGVSNASLLTIYKSEHSPARTQMFWIKMRNVKLYVATHFIRHHAGSQPFQLTCRDDRKGGSPMQKEKCKEISQKLYDALDSSNEGYREKIISSIEDVNWLAENADRNTPVNLSLLINAQALIDIAKLRMCNQASKETRDAFYKIREAIEEIDPDLAKMMVPKCIYRGGICGEPRCCGFNNTKYFQAGLKEYLEVFSDKQKGIVVP